VIVDEDEIEVRGRGHLITAEPPHADHHHRSVFDLAVRREHRILDQRRECDDRGVRDVGEAAADGDGIGLALQQLQPDAKLLVFGPAPHDVEPLLEALGWTQRCKQAVAQALDRRPVA